MYCITGFVSIFLIYIVYKLWVTDIVANNSNNWNKTQGVITYSQIETSEYSLDTENLGNMVRSKLILKYKYKVNDYEYIGNTISFKTQSTNKQQLLIKQKYYPVNKKVSVYYNPKNIKQVVLEKGSEGVSKVKIIFTFINIFFIFLTVVFIRKSKSV
ncbi:DUF3592 domain-containing protein [Polaribacter sp. Z022]|uniref:DUF3592 domain-containing protein n=1 Tax=Polaribacter sp. Z022 TaxID=2927125 RepID=UPI00202107EB|nr:DUF3592 domain-containing protein [Polaribacter sp. Z022]MCL7752184.1 DUF3592 domain-containing protein [Polaribacter sp. Z022]